MNSLHKVRPTDVQVAPLGGPLGGPSGSSVLTPRQFSPFQSFISYFKPDTSPKTVSRQVTSQRSSITDYRRLNTTEERVKACLRTYTANVVSVHGSRESTLPFDEQIVFDFMETQKRFGLSESEVHLVLIRLAYLHVVEKAEYDPYRILALFLKTLMGYVDLATDIATMAMYVKKFPIIAAGQGGILAFSFVCQCFFSIALGQPLWVGLVGLIGMKPALEAWRDATGAETFKRQKVGRDFMMWMCRCVEMVTETIPQALIQVVALLMIDNSDRTSLQYVSLAISLLTAGSAIAFTDRTLDKDKARRTVDPHLFGYVPSFENGQYRQLFLMVVFFSTYIGAKMFALSVLVARGGMVIVGGWLFAEFATLLALRVSVGNWRVYRRGVDGVGVSMLVHFWLYTALLSAPFPLLRNPTLLTSRVYSGGLLYMLLINFAQVGVAYHRYKKGTVDETTAWGVLVLLTIVCVASGAGAYRLVPSTHKRTFYEHLTFRRHVETFWWNEAMHNFDHNRNELNDIDGTRAGLPLWISPNYLPIERCVAFYAENWERWEEDPPEWFDEEFKAAIPFELRPRNSYTYSSCIVGRVGHS